MISAIERFGKGCRGVVGASLGLAACLSSKAGEPPEPGVEVTALIGGSALEMVRDLTFDADGGLIVVGSTDSADFPATDGAFDRTFNGTTDGFVAKVDSAGALVWATYLGGPGFDRIYAVERDSSGFIYVAGRAGSGFPTTPGSFQPEFGGGSSVPPYDRQDGFVCKLAPRAERVVFCSYFGTSDNQPVRDLVLAQNGDIFLAASVVTTSPRLPATWFVNAAQSEPRGATDGVVARITGDGSRVIWASYVGGSGPESGEPSIRLTSGGDPIVFYITGSPDAPTPNGFQRERQGRWDAYLARLSSDGSRLVFGSYFGGSGAEMSETHNLWLDREDHIYLAAGTMSRDLPVTANAFQTSYRGDGGRGTGDRTNYPGDAFVAKLSSDSGRVLAATYLGGSLGEAVEGIGIDAAGRIVVSGGTYSSDLPVTRDAAQPAFGGDVDAFVAILSPGLDSLQYLSYLGGRLEDIGRATAVSEAGGIAFAGPARSAKAPRVDGRHARGGGDAFLVRVRSAVAAR